MSAAQANPISKSASPSKTPSKPTPDTRATLTPSSQKSDPDVPTYETIQDYLKGKDVTLFAPADHWFTQVYCEVKRDDTFGRFSCTIIDVTVDEATGTPMNAIIQYRDRGARTWGARDLINLEGISISTSYLLPNPKDFEDEVAGDGGIPS